MEEQRPTTPQANVYPGQAQRPNSQMPQNGAPGYNAGARPTYGAYPPRNPYGQNPYGQRPVYGQQAQVRPQPSTQPAQQQTQNTTQQAVQEEPLVREREKPEEEKKTKGKRSPKKFLYFLGFVVSLAGAIGLIILFMLKK